MCLWNYRTQQVGTGETNNKRIWWTGGAAYSGIERLIGPVIVRQRGGNHTVCVPYHSQNSNYQWCLMYIDWHAIWNTNHFWGPWKYLAYSHWQRNSDKWTNANLQALLIDKLLQAKQRPKIQLWPFGDNGLWHKELQFATHQPGWRMVFIGLENTPRNILPSVASSYNCVLCCKSILSMYTLDKYDLFSIMLLNINIKCAIIPCHSTTLPLVLELRKCPVFEQHTEHLN